MLKGSKFLLATVLLSGLGDVAAAATDSVYVVPVIHGIQEPESLPMPAPPELIVGAMGARELTFHLPEDLVGPDFEPFRLLETAPATSRFAGADADADCAEDEASFNCRITYASRYGQKIRPVEVERFLRAKYANDPALLGRRLALFNAFRFDPEGRLILFK